MLFELRQYQTRVRVSLDYACNGLKAMSALRSLLFHPQTPWKELLPSTRGTVMIKHTGEAIKVLDR